MPRPITLTIHLSALAHNLKRVRHYVPASKILAVAKANAYGHGIDCAIHGFAQADGLALIKPELAVALRASGWTKPILLLEGFFDTQDLALALAYGFEMVIHCEEQLQQLESIRPSLTIHPLRLHLKMNSGMNRLGFQPDQYLQAYSRLRALPHVRDIILMTHFANADDPKNKILPIAEQLRQFTQTAYALPGERSLSNSATIVTHPHLSADWVRPGIMLYGVTPIPDQASAATLGLQPVMTLSSEIIARQAINAGNSVGYGSQFFAQTSMNIGIVACGYADGYPRHAPSGTPVLVEGMPTRTLGCVSMDMLAVDITHIPHAHVGSPVILWGHHLPVDQVATAAGTIAYELLSAVTQRVKRQTKID